MNEKRIVDPDLGEVIFVRKPNARRYIIRVRDGQVRVTLPWNGTLRFAQSFVEENRQALVAGIEKEKERRQAPDDEWELRQQANAHLPQLIAQLAKEHGFRYQRLNIRKSRTRWGSCSSKGTISLSLYLMRLPAHLIEYVILHELCHTIEMNHSPAFWELLNQHTDGKAKSLRKELKNYPI